MRISKRNGKYYVDGIKASLLDIVKEIMQMEDNGFSAKLAKLGLKKQEKEWTNGIITVKYGFSSRYKTRAYRINLTGSDTEKVLRKQKEVIEYLEKLCVKGDEK